MEILLWSITACLLLQLVFVLWNLRQMPILGGTGEGLKWLSEAEERHATPKLSILIPARDEAANIAGCIRSVLAAPYDAVEVIVLDDRSADGTAELARTAGDGDPRLQVLAGEALPGGWLGKAYACHQLSRLARGEWWLFLDADARLSPHALADAMDTALIQQDGLITGFPRQVTGSWAERLIVPLMNFTIACHLPIRLVGRSPDPRFVAAHGAFMLVKAEAYRKCGGHAASRLHLVDDMELARSFKRADYPVMLADVTRQVEMRMYRNAFEVWNGYKKNLYAGVGRSPFLLGFVMLLYALFYLLPVAACLSAAVFLGCGGAYATASNVLLPSLTAWFLGVVIKFAVDRKGRLPGSYAWLLPPGILLLIGIAWASWRASAGGAGYLWKGRRYS